MYGRELSNPQKLILSLFIFFELGCSSKLIVVTEPSDVEVSINRSGGARKVLGKSPVEVDLNSLQKDIPLSEMTGNMFEMHLEKDGYESRDIWTPRGQFGLVKETVYAKLSPKEESARTADLLLQGLHNAQKFASNGNYTSAMNAVDEIITKNPRFIRAYTMKGAILFSQNKWDESLSMYEKALELDKQFDEAIRMIALIKQKKGQ